VKMTGVDRIGTDLLGGGHSERVQE
jgi:hypothetical protein